MVSPTAPLDSTLLERFERIRQTLLSDRYAERRQKPLAYWTVPTDRRLPLAFMHRTLDELLDASPHELAATPGVGRKKMLSLVQLLQRAARDTAGDAGNLQELAELTGPLPARLPPKRPDSWQLDANAVSEPMWDAWRHHITGLDLGQETLGRMAPSLQLLPTVIWDKPLSSYLAWTLADVRGMRTHGEKRVRGIVQTVHSVWIRTEHARDADQAKARLVPDSIRKASQSVHELSRFGVRPTGDDVRRRLVMPLLEQVLVDSGEAIYQLAADRLGLDGPPRPVKDIALRLALTRARVYQLLDDCAHVLRVRWPDGSEAMDRAIHVWISRRLLDQDVWDLVYRTYELLFARPQRRPGGRRDSRRTVSRAPASYGPRRAR